MQLMVAAFSKQCCYHVFHLMNEDVALGYVAS
jgi:hypothetical protein